jgi:hypothetical protein
MQPDTSRETSFYHRFYRLTDYFLRNKDTRHQHPAERRSRPQQQPYRIRASPRRQAARQSRATPARPRFKFFLVSSPLPA